MVQACSCVEFRATKEMPDVCATCHHSTKCHVWVDNETREVEEREDEVQDYATAVNVFAELGGGGGTRDEYTFFVSGAVTLDQSSVTAHSRGNVALNDHLCLEFPREAGLVVSFEEGEFRAEVPIPCSEAVGEAVGQTVGAGSGLWSSMSSPPSSLLSSSLSSSPPPSSYSASWRGTYDKSSLEVKWSETSSRLWGSLDYRGCLRREHDKGTGTSWLELSGAFSWSAQPSVRGTFELRLDDSSAFSDHSLWTDMPCSFRSCSCLRFNGESGKGVGARKESTHSA